MFDCGEGTQRQMFIAGLNPLKLNDLFITHWHGDHCLGIPGLIDTMGFEGKQEAVNIYSPEPRRAKRCSNFVNYTMGKVRINARKVPCRGKKLSGVLDKERFSIISAPVRHSIPAVAYAFVEKDKITVDPVKAGNMGLPGKGEIYKDLAAGKIVTIRGSRISLDDIGKRTRGKKVVFSGDTEVCDNLRVLAEGADLLIQDCTYFEKKEGALHKHACFEDIAAMVQSCNIGKTVLTHISRKYRDADALEDIISGYDNFIIAEDLQVIEL
jgi:ribonuclease Z